MGLSHSFCAAANKIIPFLKQKSGFDELRGKHAGFLLSVISGPLTRPQRVSVTL